MSLAPDSQARRHKINWSNGEHKWCVNFVDTATTPIIAYSAARSADRKASQAASLQEAGF